MPFQKGNQFARKKPITAPPAPKPAKPAPPKPELDLTDPLTLQLLKALEHREKYARIQTLFPDKGKFRRQLYKKSMLHFSMGAKYNQRLFMAANRVGKLSVLAEFNQISDPSGRFSL